MLNISSQEITYRVWPDYEYYDVDEYFEDCSWNKSDDYREITIEWIGTEDYDITMLEECQGFQDIIKQVADGETDKTSFRLLWLQ